MDVLKELPEELRGEIIKEYQLQIKSDYFASTNKPQLNNTNKKTYEPKQKIDCK